MQIIVTCKLLPAGDKTSALSANENAVYWKKSVMLIERQSFQISDKKVQKKV